MVPKRYVLEREVTLTLQRGDDTLPHNTGPIPHRRLLSLNRERPVISRQTRFSPPTPPAFTEKGHQEVVATGWASSPSEPVGQDPALQAGTARSVVAELLFYVIRYAVAHRVGLIGQGEVGLQALPEDAVERCGLGAAPAIGLRMGAGRWPGWWCGPPDLPARRMGLNRHQRPPASRGTVGYVSTPKTADRWGGGTSILLLSSFARAARRRPRWKWDRDVP